MFTFWMNAAHFFFCTNVRWITTRNFTTSSWSYTTRAHCMWTKFYQSDLFFRHLNFILGFGAQHKFVEVHVNPLSHRPNSPQFSAWVLPSGHTVTVQQSNEVVHTLFMQLITSLPLPLLQQRPTPDWKIIHSVSSVSQSVFTLHFPKDGWLLGHATKIRE